MSRNSSPPSDGAGHELTSTARGIARSVLQPSRSRGRIQTFVHYTPDVEEIDPDEQKTFDAIVAAIGKGGEITRECYGRYPDSHAKAHGLLEAELTVEADLAPELAQGLFAQPGRYRAIVRLAHMPGELLDDRGVSTPRGMATKVLDVHG